MLGKFYVSTIQHFVDGSPSVASIFEYDNKRAAYAAYFYNLSSAASNENMKSIYCELLNEFGDISDRKYIQFVEDPDEEEESKEEEII